MGINERFFIDTVAFDEPGPEVSPIETVQTPALLVAMPSLLDPYFQKSVILLCEYTLDHAYGMVVNRPSTLAARDLINDATRFKREVEGPLLVGGPVSPEFMWALHSPEYASESTAELGPLSMTAIQEVLFSLRKGQGPEKYLLGSGYAGWGPGQLDRELSEGAWWIAPLNPALILDMPYDLRWEFLLSSLGIDPFLTCFHTTGEA